MKLSSKFKKNIALFLAILTLTALLGACGKNNNTSGSSEPTSENLLESETLAGSEDPGSEESVKDDVTVRVAGMTGPTSIGMVKMISDTSNGTALGSYDFTIAGSADEITPLIVKGELDIAAVPANLASVLYNKTEGKVKLLAVNNLGVLYIVDKGEEINSLEDLRGKTIYATGKGSTPEYTLRYVLKGNGIDPDNDVTIEYKSEPAEIVALFKSSDSGIAMLPQPFVTAAKAQVEGLEVSLDLGAEWKKLDETSDTVTGVIIARSEFIDAHPEAVKVFLDEYTASCEFVNENVEAAAQMTEDAGIFKAAIAKAAIPFCNVTGTVGTEMKTAVSKYLSVLYAENPASVGGALPDDNFYYLAD